MLLGPAAGYIAVIPVGTNQFILFEGDRYIPLFLASVPSCRHLKPDFIQGITEPKGEIKIFFDQKVVGRKPPFHIFCRKLVQREHHFNISLAAAPQFAFAALARPGTGYDCGVGKHSADATSLTSARRRTEHDL
jgi:hypothetical protein